MATTSAYVEHNAASEFHETDPFTERRYDQFADHLPEGARDVLDVGCNTGRGGAVLKHRHPDLHLTGLDVVPDRIDRLPELYDDGLCCSAADLPHDDERFDAIVAGEFLEHLYPADVDPVLCEFQRVLAIGGRLLLTTPNPNYLRNRLTRTSVLGHSHLTQHEPRVLRLRLKLHGFRRIRIRGSGRVSTRIGPHVPYRAVYGSYLVSADKI